MVFLKLFTCGEKAVKISTLCSIRKFHKKMALSIFYPAIYSFSTSLFVFVATAFYSRRSVKKSNVRLSTHKFLSVL